MDWMLPALAIAPMGCAVIAYALGRKNERARDVFSICVAVTTFAATAALLALALSGDGLFCRVPGVCGFGLTFRLDGFRALYAAVAAFMWMMTGLLSPEYFAKYRNRNRYAFFTLMTLGATLGVLLSDDLYTTFLFFEIMSLTSYAWVAHDEKPGAMRAAETYLAVAVIGGMAALMGLFLLYDRLGTLEFAGLLEQAKLLQNPQGLYLPGALLLVGFGAKAGLFPLHIWLPKAHPVAPAPASALLSGVLTKTGVFGILVISCNLFLHDTPWELAILLLGTVTMCLGALMALFSIDLKRTLACSSMSQIGFIAVGVGTMGLLGEHNALAASGTVLHMLNHSLFKLVLFMAAGVVYMNLHKLNLNDIRGFGRKKPLLHVCFLLASAGIAGVPLLNGFVSKSLLHEGIIEYIHHLEGGVSPIPYIIIEKLFLISGGMTAAYMTKLYVAIFWEKNEPDVQARYDGMTNYMSPLSAFALCGSAILLPLLGLFPGVFMRALSNLSMPFLHASEPSHAVRYFSWENLHGAAQSLAVGAALYLLVVRPLRKRAGAYVNRLPTWLDLEDAVYRPLLAFLLSACGLICAGLDKLLDVLVVALKAVGVFIARLAASLVDGVALFLRHTVLSVLRARHPAPVGNRFTFALGSALDALVSLLNRTVRRRRPITTRFVYTLAAGWEELVGAGRITRSLSFGLLLFVVGLFLTLLYLLAR